MPETAEGIAKCHIYAVYWGSIIYVAIALAVFVLVYYGERRRK